MQPVHQAQQCGVVYNIAGPRITRHFIYGWPWGSMTHAHATRLTPGALEGWALEIDPPTSPPHELNTKAELELLLAAPCSALSQYATRPLPARVYSPSFKRSNLGSPVQLRE